LDFDIRTISNLNLLFVSEFELRISAFDGTGKPKLRQLSKARRIFDTCRRWRFSTIWFSPVFSRSSFKQCWQVLCLRNT